MLYRVARINSVVYTYYKRYTKSRYDTSIPTLVENALSNLERVT